MSYISCCNNFSLSFHDPGNLTYWTPFVHTVQFMTSVNCMYSDSVQIQTMAQGEEKSPAHNRWRSISLFGMSANTWRDFYRSGAMFRSCEPGDKTSHHITGNKQEHTVHVAGTSRCPPSNCQHLSWHFSGPLWFISDTHTGYWPTSVLLKHIHMQF
jgi:hypothetical protein